MPNLDEGLQKAFTITKKDNTLITLKTAGEYVPSDIALTFSVQAGALTVGGGDLSQGEGASSITSNGYYNGSSYNTSDKVTLGATETIGYYKITAAGSGTVNRAAIEKQVTAAGWLAADAGAVVPTGLGATSLTSKSKETKYYIKKSTTSGGTVSNGNSTVTPGASPVTVTISDGYYPSSRTVTINSIADTSSVGTVTSGSATISTVTFGNYDTTNDNFPISGSAAIGAPNVDEAGYISNTVGTRNGNTATLSTTVKRITGTTSISVGSGTGTSDISRKPTLSKQAISITGVTDAASGSATETAPSSGVYVAVKSGDNKAKLTATPTVSSGGAGYGTTGTNGIGITASTRTIGAAASNVTYIPITTVSPVFDGGALTGTAQAAASNSTCTLSDSTNTSGVAFTTSCTATRADVLYNGAVSGWVTAANDAIALEHESTSLTSKTYYVNTASVPSGKTFSVTTTGTTKVTSNSNTTGIITINAYPASGSTRDGERTIVSAGKWQCLNSSGTVVSSLAAGTYYGKVVIGAVSGTIGGTATAGAATAAINNVNSMTTITNLSGKTAGTDYWQVKATASGTAGGYKPKYTVNTAGWIASTVEADSNATVNVTGDSTGKSIYIPKATFSVGSDNHSIVVSTAGYIPANTTVGTISTGSVSAVSSDPGNSYTELTASSSPNVVIPSGGWLKIDAGYYGNTKISLATLVPDSITGYTLATSQWIHPSYAAYGANGQEIKGSMTIYTGDYTLE